MIIAPNSFLATVPHSKLYAAVIEQVGGWAKFTKEAQGIVKRGGAFVHGLTYNDETLLFVGDHLDIIMAKVSDDADYGLYGSEAEYISSLDGLEGLLENQVEHALKYKAESNYYLLVWLSLTKAIILDVARDFLQYQAHLPKTEGISLKLNHNVSEQRH